MFDAKNSDVNKCADQAGPGRAPWAKHKIMPPPASQPLVPAAAAVPKPSAAAKPRPPAKQIRYAEVQVILSDDWDSLPEPAAIPGRRQPETSVPSLAAIDRPQPRRAGAQAALTQGPAGPKEVLGNINVPSQREAQPVAAQALLMKDAGGKAPFDSLPALLAMLKQEDRGLRAEAADELGHLGAAAAPAVPELMKALDDESRRVRSSAGLALGNIGPAARGAVPKLINALKDKNLDVRYNASLALSRIGTPKALKALKRFISEEAYRRIEQE
jgi:hypothetical protein